MIRGIEPVKAMSYISDLTLYFVVFCLPPNVQPDVSVGCQRTYPMESFSSLKEYHPNFNHDSLLASNSFSSAYSGDDAESTSSTKGLEPTSSQLKLERAKTERQRPHNILAEEASQIFDDKIPVQQKIWNRLSYLPIQVPSIVVLFRRWVGLELRGGGWIDSGQ
ncbi:hypothetical protein LINPERPRIM_LOCUS28997 [Linum perenne]